MSRAGDTVNAANRARQSAVEQAQKATEKIRDMNEDRLLAKAAEIEARREKEEQKAFESTGDEDNTRLDPGRRDAVSASAETRKGCGHLGWAA